MKTIDRKNILFALSESRGGFDFGTPERVNQESLSVVLPILRHSSTPRIYTTFPETDKLQMKDSGSIDTMKAHNAGQLAVFLRSGTIFKGGTQERASLRSMIVLAGQDVDVKVRCIHASRGISRDAKVSYGGSVPLMYDQMNYTAGFTASGQSEYWGNAKTMSSYMRSASAGPGPHPTRPTSARPSQPQMRGMRTRYSAAAGSAGLRTRHALVSDPFVGMADSSVLNEVIGSDDLHTEFSAFSASMDDVLSKVNIVDDQVGLGLITERGCETVELFESGDSWKALHSDAVKRLGPNMAAKDRASVFEYRPEKAKEVVRAVLALPFEERLVHEHKPSNGDPSFTVTSLTAKDYTGEVVELDGRMIHLLIIKLGVS